MRSNSTLTAILFAACSAVTLALTGGAATAQSFPSKPITLVVGYSAGGQADALARAVAKGLSESLKVPVVVENKPGANGVIAGQGVARAVPDGHTLLLVTDAGLTIDPQLPGSAKWNPSQVLEPVVNLATAPLFVAAHKDVPADTLPALVDLGKKGGLSYGTSGNATPHRLAGEMLQKLGGFQMTHIPYKGTAASVTDLAGGQISLVIGSSTALEPLAKVGKIKFIAATSQQRFPLLPQVPAAGETYPGFDMSIFFGMMVPKGTAAPVVSMLNAEVNKLLATPETREALGKLGVIPAGGTPADFLAKVEADYRARGLVMRELDIKAD